MLSRRYSNSNSIFPCSSTGTVVPKSVLHFSNNNNPTKRSQLTDSTVSKSIVHHSSPINKTTSPLKSPLNSSSPDSNNRKRNYNASSNTSVQPHPLVDRNELLATSISPVQPVSKADRLDKNSNPSNLSQQSTCHENITNAISELQAKVDKFVLDSKVTQTKNDDNIVELEKSLEDIEKYSRKLKEMKKIFKSKIGHLDSILNAKLSIN